ncbi:putative beta-lactamase [Nocardia nova SH22a]|uniref:Putative beta-lactamase n=1 Tax=Nocardia nova SH22a TaxID=1415166 RepID=W5TCA6_9NOCA|nr:serine hydrolase domain-containing protein [Nocardia nova]AHH16975.1 putative beta-lactamase [Nocardia nova SH22a]
MSRKHRGVRRLRGVAALIVAVSLSLAACGDDAETVRFPADVAQTVDRIVETSIAAGLIPGATVSIIDPQRGTYTHAYGVADIGTGRPADVHDRYRIGSITKTFTATAVLRLADQGKLSLDDHLSRYVGGIPNGDIIRLRDLLGMRGGVYNYAADPSYLGYAIGRPDGEVYDRESALRVIRSHPEKAQPPDIRTVYSNSEYFLLGIVLEKATGRPLRDVLNSVAADLGLPDTEYPLGPALLPPASRGYAYQAGKPVDVTSFVGPEAVGAAGAMVSTVGDLGQYVLKLDRGDLLKPDTFRARSAFTPMDGSVYGLGLWKVGSWIGHNGAIPGYSSIAMAMPDRGVSVAVLVNQETLPMEPFSIRADNVFDRIADALYPGTLRPATPPAQSPPIPSPADLTPRLQATLDPAANPATPPLPIEGTDADPALPATIADAYRSQGISLRVDRTTDFGNGVMAATTTLTTGNDSVPMIIMLNAHNGTWTLSRGWACESLAAFSPQHSPACG